MGLKEIIADFRERNEKQLTQFAAELLQNQQFTDALVQAVQMATTARNEVDKRLQGAFKAMSLPGREEFDAVAGKVKDLAKSLSDLDNRISRLARQIEEKMKAGEEAKTLRSELEAKDKELRAKEKELASLQKKMNAAAAAQ